MNRAATAPRYRMNELANNLLILQGFIPGSPNQNNTNSYKVNKNESRKIVTVHKKNQRGGITKSAHSYTSKNNIKKAVLEGLIVLVPTDVQARAKTNRIVKSNKNAKNTNKR